jgi:hypothetical protein
MEISRGATVTIWCVLTLDDEAWLALHEVRLRGLVVVEDTTATHIERLTEIGYVVRAPRGVRVTTEGREAHTSWARLGPGSDDESTVRRAYERFLPLNQELLQVCSAWQLRPGGVPNDHTDLRYDWSIVDRLRALDERAAPPINRVGRVHARFAAYRPRLRAALTQLDDGGFEWLTSPRCDSYHTVWMQLHEDLLLALGIERASEESLPQ